MRTLLILALVLLALAPTAARAETIGVVVDGEVTLQPALVRTVERWLRTHHFAIDAGALSPDATRTLVDCFRLEDEQCARSVVDTRAKTDVVVFARLARPSAGDIQNTLTLLVYWFRKASPPTIERAYCERCTEQTLVAVADATLTRLVASATKGKTGKLRLSSQPPGALVRVDDQPIGITPLDFDVTPGPHKIVVTKPDHEVETREVTVRAGATEVIDTTLTPLAHTSSGASKVPWLITGLGGALVASGVVLFVTSETEDGSDFTYRNTRPAGLALGVAGLATAAVGVYLWRRGSSADATEPAPVVTVARDGVAIGWTRAF